MDEHHADVAVASLGDVPEPSDLPGGVFSGREPEVGGEVPAGAEAVEIAYERDERGGGEPIEGAFRIIYEAYPASGLEGRPGDVFGEGFGIEAVAGAYYQLEDVLERLGP